MSPALDRRHPPVPGDPSSFALPAFTRHRLSSGLELLVAPLDHTPLVDLAILMPAGGQYAADGLGGLPSFHAALLDEGTATRSALDIARDAEQLGGALATGVDWDIGVLHLSTLARNLDAGIELVGDLLLASSFSTDEIERQQRERAAQILRRRQQPAFQAATAFTDAIYGDGIYAQPLMGTPETLERFDRDTIRAFYRRHVVPNACTAVVTGAVDPDDLCRRFERVLGAATPGTLPTRPTIDAPDPRPAIIIVDRPGAEQTQLMMGHVSVPRSHPGHGARTLTNAVLGGSFTSRINLNLREKHGLTYGASSRFPSRHGPGPFVVRAAVTTTGVGLAVTEVRNEVDRLRTERVPADELRDVQRYLIGLFAYGLQTIEQVGNRLEALVVHDLGDDYYETFPHVLSEITADQVLDAAQRFMHPESMTIVAVGPAETLRDQLEPFGPITVQAPPSADP